MGHWGLLVSYAALPWVARPPSTSASGPRGALAAWS